MVIVNLLTTLLWQPKREREKKGKKKKRYWRCFFPKWRELYEVFLDMHTSPDDKGIDFTAGPCQTAPFVSCLCMSATSIESRQPLCLAFTLLLV